jgi:hypothetical protein
VALVAGMHKLLTIRECHAQASELVATDARRLTFNTVAPTASPRRLVNHYVPGRWS